MQSIKYVGPAAAACVAAILLVNAPALAGPLGLSEIRGGPMLDDVELFAVAPLGSPIGAVPRPETLKLSNLNTAAIDLLFETPDFSGYFSKPELGPWFNWLLSPRLDLGATLDFQRESMVHASLNWHLPLGGSGFFIEPELGGALHNGALTGAVAPMRNLGCRTLFYWSLNIGYQFDENWSLLATEQHASQDGLCGWANNQGLNYDGIRLSYKF